MRRTLSGLLAALLLALFAISRVLTQGEPVSAQPAAVEPADTRIRASDVTSLEGQVGKEVTVYGRVKSTNKSRSGHQFLNFYNAELTVICRSNSVANFKDGEPAQAYRGKDVEVSGELERYKGKLQIQLRQPSQVRVVAAPSGRGSKPVQLKQVGNNRWLSPAGLVYQGRDSNGLSRVEHIERHVRDIPDRPGPHGVFDGGSEVAFGVIDEAWNVAEKRGLKPKREGNRSLFDVSLGRRIGYLGGTSGKRKNHPPLSRVRIVFETGTKNIVTAFPKER